MYNNNTGDDSGGPSSGGGSEKIPDLQTTLVAPGDPLAVDGAVPIFLAGKIRSAKAMKAGFAPGAVADAFAAEAGPVIVGKAFRFLVGDDLAAVWQWPGGGVGFCGGHPACPLTSSVQARLSAQEPTDCARR